jgi:hypothetical protein
VTAGQIATSFRQIRTSLLVAALAAAFGLGLLIGLVAQRAASPGALAITNGGAPAAAAAVNSRVADPAVDTGAQNFRGAQDIRAAAGGSSIGITPVLDPKPYLTVQAGVVPGSVSAAGAVDTGAQNFRGAQDIRAASAGPGMSSPDPSAASTGSGTYADYLALLRAKRDGGVTAKFGAVHKPYPL